MPSESHSCSSTRIIKARSNDNDDKDDGIACFKCGKKGYKMPDCPNCNAEETNDDDGESNHISRSKPKTSKRSKSEQKPKKKSVTFIQNVGKETKESDYSFFQKAISLTHKDDTRDLQDFILLDNQSTVDAWCNKNLVQDIWKSNETMILRSNGGTITTNTKARVKGYGNVWFNPKYITNVMALKNIKKKYRVTYDSQHGDAFIVHHPDKPNMKFIMHEDGLHYYDMRQAQGCIHGDH